MRKPLKRIFLFAAAILAAWSFFGVSAALRPFREKAIRSTFAPFGRFFASAAQAGRTAFLAATADARAAVENETLKAEIERLRVEAADASACREEIAALRRELRFAKRTRGVVAAEVLSEGSASGWSGALDIDRGSAAGISPGNPVLTPDGLVGRVVSVTERTARVMPLTDRNCRLSCVVEGFGDAGHGIIEGGGFSRPAEGLALLHVVEPLEVSFLDKDATLTVGARVFTAGDGRAYPRGLLIGRVMSVDHDSTRLFQRAGVRPAVSFHNLRRVFVLTSMEARP